MTEPPYPPPPSFQDVARDWSVTNWQDWLLRGLAIHIAVKSATSRESASDSARLETAFWPALVDPRQTLPDAIIAVVETVPGAVPTFARAVTACLPLWTPPQGPSIILYLPNLSRLARAPDLPERLRHFLSYNNFASKIGSDIVAACLELILVLARTDGAHQLLDLVRNSSRLWQPAHASLWLRAKLRCDYRNWIADLVVLEPDLKASGTAVDLRRFLDRVLDDLPGLAEIALSIERYMTGGGIMHRHDLFMDFTAFGNELPWFFTILFDGDRPLLRLELNQAYELRRVRRYGPQNETLMLRELGPDDVFTRNGFWRHIAHRGIRPQRPADPSHGALATAVSLSWTRFL